MSLHPYLKLTTILSYLKTFSSTAISFSAKDEDKSIYYVAGVEQSMTI